MFPAVLADTMRPSRSVVSAGTQEKDRQFVYGRWGVNYVLRDVSCPLLAIRGWRRAGFRGRGSIARARSFCERSECDVRWGESCAIYDRGTGSWLRRCCATHNGLALLVVACAGRAGVGGRRGGGGFLCDSQLPGGGWREDADYVRGRVPELFYLTSLYVIVIFPLLALAGEIRPVSLLTQRPEGAETRDAWRLSEPSSSRGFERICCRLQATGTHMRWYSEAKSSAKLQLMPRLMREQWRLDMYPGNHGIMEQRHRGGTRPSVWR